MAIRSMTAAHLIRADQFIDRAVPLLNVASNAVNIFLKIGICVNRALHSETAFEKNRADSPNGHYWEYLDNKTFTSCFLGLIPGLAKISTWFSTYLTASWDSPSHAKWLIKFKGVDHFEQAPIAMLYDREFMVTTLGIAASRGQSQKILNNAKYKSLPEQYRESVEAEAGLGKQKTQPPGAAVEQARNTALRHEQIKAEAGVSGEKRL